MYLLCCSCNITEEVMLYYNIATILVRFIICNVFLMFSVQLDEGWYTHCSDTCEQGGQQRRVSELQTNARAQVHSDQEACPQICVSWLEPSATLPMCKIPLPIKCVYDCGWVYVCLISLYGTDGWMNLNVGVFVVVPRRWCLLNLRTKKHNGK